MVSVPKAVMHPHFKWGLLVLVVVILFFFLFQGGRDTPDPPESPESPEPAEPQSAAAGLIEWPASGQSTIPTRTSVPGQPAREVPEAGPIKLV